MKHRIYRGVGLGGLAGLILLCIYLVIPMFIMLFKGTEEYIIQYHIETWAMPLEPIIFVLIIIMGIIGFIHMWRT